MTGVADGFHPPLEEYLEAIHELDEEGTTVIQARLAERLGHTAPAVSEMTRRLKDEGYVTVKGRSVSLTAQGRSLVGKAGKRGLKVTLSGSGVKGRTLVLKATQVKKGKKK